MSKKIVTSTTSFSELRKNFDWVLSLIDKGKVIEVTEKRHPIAYLFKIAAESDVQIKAQYDEVYLRRNFFEVFQKIEKPESSPIQINRFEKPPIVISSQLN